MNQGELLFGIVSILCSRQPIPEDDSSDAQTGSVTHQTGMPHAFQVERTMHMRLHPVLTTGLVVNG